MARPISLEDASLIQDAIIEWLDRHDTATVRDALELWEYATTTIGSLFIATRKMQRAIAASDVDVDRAIDILRSDPEDVLRCREDALIALDAMRARIGQHYDATAQIVGDDE